MSKQRRQQALLELISEYEIDTQEELTRRLQALGFETTQATVSRDIRELKLEKVSYGSGKHRYAASLEPDTGTHASYQHVMASCILSIEAAQNIIVVKTVSGMAMAAAAARLLLKSTICRWKALWDVLQAMIRCFWRSKMGSRQNI